MSEPLDADVRRSLAREIHDLAGGWGVPGSLQYAADRLPGSVTADAAYDLSLAVGVLLTDLAAVLDAEDDT